MFHRFSFIGQDVAFVGALNKEIWYFQGLKSFISFWELFSSHKRVHSSFLGDMTIPLKKWQALSDVAPPKDECFAIQTFNKCDDIVGSLLVSNPTSCLLLHMLQQNKKNNNTCHIYTTNHHKAVATTILPYFSKVSFHINSRVGAKCLMVQLSALFLAQPNIWAHLPPVKSLGDMLSLGKVIRISHVWLFGLKKGKFRHYFWWNISK